jgi:DNA-binding NarL/FixJ family response regulator
MKILAAIHDLMFSSKVNAAAKGRAISWLPRGSKVAEQVAAQKPDVLLIDLGAQQLDAVNAIKEIKSGDAKGTVVIGYLDHTRADLIEAARAAGCDQVLSKGEFARRLPELLDGI